MINKKYLSLVVCIVASIFVVLKMHTGSNLFLIIFFLLVSIGMLLDKDQHRIEYLLFFTSWVYVIKFDLNSYSLLIFLCFLYIVMSLISLIKNNHKFSYRILFSFFLFVFYIITVTLIFGGGLIEIIGFLVNYTVIFLAIQFINDRTNFKRFITIYAIGLLMTCLVRILSYAVTSLNHFIESLTVINTVNISGNLSIRFAGLDLDPNYFSLQVLVAMACLIVQLYYEESLKKSSMFILIALGIFGVLSFSKMFLFSLLMLIIISLVPYIKNNVKKTIKYASIVMVICGIGLFFYYEKLFQVYWIRIFGAGKSAEAITTGRFQQWTGFINEIFSDVKILLFGVGYGSAQINGLMAHNMYLTTLYIVGLIGSIITILFLYSLYKELQRNTLINRDKSFNLLLINNIPLYVILIANMALDSFVMDFFPYQVLLIMVALFITYNSNEQKDKII